ncbi:MAG: WcaI family glycosyltransferase [Pseudomonadota bacterium]
MKLLIVALNYAPDLIGCARYTSELAEDFVARGHAVEVVCGPPYYPSWSVAEGYSGARWRTEVLAGVAVHRTPLYVPAKPTGIPRLAHVASFGAAAAPAAIAAARRFRPHVVLAIAPTLAAGAAALMAARTCGAKTWLHLQDFEVDAAFGLGLLKSETGRQAALAIERRLLGSFDHVSTLSPAMVGLLHEKGVDPSRTSELRNWVDVDASPVLATTNTALRQELGLTADAVVALYSGNMAAKQGIESLGEMAARLNADAPSIQLLFGGEGPEKSALEQATAGLAAVRLLPLQPVARLPELLGAADIHLLPQRPEAADLVLPSKLGGMLASGRPVVAMAEDGTDLAQEVEGCGLITKPTGAAMAEAVLTLAGDHGRRQVMGRNGRLRAEQRWRKATIIDAFEDRFQATAEV